MMPTSVVTGGEGCLPVKRRFLTDGPDAADPILIDHLVVIPDLFILRIVDFVDGYLGSWSGIA